MIDHIITTTGAYGFGAFIVTAKDQEQALKMMERKYGKVVARESMDCKVVKMYPSTRASAHIQRLGMYIE